MFPTPSKRSKIDETISYDPPSNREIVWHYELAEILQRIELPESVSRRFQLTKADIAAIGPMMRSVYGTDDLQRLRERYISVFELGTREEDDDRPPTMTDVTAYEVVLEDRMMASYFDDFVEEGAFSKLRRLHVSTSIPFQPVRVSNLLWAVCRLAGTLEVLSVRLEHHITLGDRYNELLEVITGCEWSLKSASLQHLELDEWLVVLLRPSDASFPALEHLVLHIEPKFAPVAEPEVIPVRGTWRSLAPRLRHFSVVLQQAWRFEVEEFAKWPKISDYALPEALESFELSLAQKYTQREHEEMAHRMRDDVQVSRTLVAQIAPKGIFAMLRCLSLDLPVDPADSIPPLDPAHWRSLEKVRVWKPENLMALLKNWHGQKLRTCTILKGSDYATELIRTLKPHLPELAGKTNALVIRSALQDYGELYYLEAELADPYENPYRRSLTQRRIEEVLSRQFGLDLVIQSQADVCKFPGNVYI